MNNKAVAFRARARTIDHLGKGQIADCPTAVSELWKNSYDAYARDVALYLFDGEYKSGVIVDNGCGMSMAQLIDSWLVVGTESKSKKEALDPKDRFGLAERKTQGEKGIGRLSSAFLAPVTLLVTKKINAPFSAALIDWRLFENTYLSLSDITVPMIEFQDLSLLPQYFDQLVIELKKNLCNSQRDDISTERQKEIRRAWEKFGQDQVELAEQLKIDSLTTEQKILSFVNNFKLNSKIANSWAPLLDKVESLDGSKHGTALFLLELERDLSLIANPGSLDKNNEELVNIEKELVDTIRSFVNPYNQAEYSLNYEIKSYAANGREREILRLSDVFDIHDFHGLEHTVEGEFDEKGWFTGQVKAWGNDKGIVKFAPTIEIDQAGSKVGAFKIKIGAFENEFDKTSLSETEFASFQEKQKKYAGLMIFRDGLRVLPYGRVDNDFFEIEERRSYSAGRHYWSTRRIFGQILITQEDNSLLKDKAGREGFIRNQAARELKSLVSGILVALSDRFFGGKSEERKELLAIVKKDRDARKEAQTQARKQSQKRFAEELRQQTPELVKYLDEIREIQENIEQIDTFDINRLTELDQYLQKFEAARSKLRTPTKPPKIGDHEDRYRSYRDMYSEYSAHVFRIKEALNKFSSELNKQSPVQTAKRLLDRNQGLLNAQVNRHLNSIESKAAGLLSTWTYEGKIDRSRYYQEALPIVEGVENGANLEISLNNLDSAYSSLSDTFTVKYEAVLRALDRLEQGINLDSAFSMAEEEKSYFENKAKNLQALAQLGISVEIMAHELEELDGMVTSGLNSLPRDIKSSHPGFKIAYDAHKALTQQIRFLSPLKLSGYQLRTEISGQDISRHIETFFRDRFIRQRVELKFGERFLKMSIKDLPSRIYPVFVNLINNALYWVCLSEYRLIHIDIVEDEVIIANSGPPVDEDDIPQLFELFYSRRSNGHGVGLYLCRENLAVAHHKIRYSPSDDIQLISGGANFVITFNGMEITQ
jgi:signal transduction histidine kinase